MSKPHRYERPPMRRRQLAAPYPPVGHTFVMHVEPSGHTMYCAELPVLLQRLAGLIAEQPDEQITVTFGTVRATTHDIDLLGPED